MSEIQVPGIRFTLKNDCEVPVRGLILANLLYTLDLGPWVTRTPVFFGDLEPGEEVPLMAAADFDGRAQLLFVQASAGAAPVTVSDGGTISVPKKYCGCSGKIDLELLKVD